MNLQKKGVQSLAVFGSVARGEETADSDVDILVSFDQSVVLFDFVPLKLCLEDLFVMPVDLMAGDVLRPEMRDAILWDGVYA